MFTKTLRPNFRNKKSVLQIRVQQKLNIKNSLVPPPSIRKTKNYSQLVRTCVRARFPTSNLRSTIYDCVVHTRFPSTPPTVCSTRMFHASLTITPTNTEQKKTHTHTHTSRNLFLQLSRKI